MRALLLALLLHPAVAPAQLLTPTLLTGLAAQVEETSGLLVVDGTAWTILDSGNPAVAYALDPSTGAIIRSVQLLGVGNVDIEAITAFGPWVYIGDFGNNSGARTNLRIYRIPRAALEDGSPGSTAVELVHFTYADQTDFTSANQQTNFDAEAFIATGDSLYIFTKRWLDQRTHVYALPAEPGTFVAELRGSYDVGGLITDAAWDQGQRLMLLGYSSSTGLPFLWSFDPAVEGDWLGGIGQRYNLSIIAHQTEGLAWRAANELLITNEANAFFPAKLWSLSIGGTGVGEARAAHQPLLFPQPARDELRLRDMAGIVRLFDASGREVLSTAAGPHDSIGLGNLGSGCYQGIIDDGQRIHRQPVLIMR